MLPGFLPFVDRAGSAGILCVSVCLAACQFGTDLTGYAVQQDVGDGAVDAAADALFEARGAVGGQAGEGGRAGQGGEGGRAGQGGEGGQAGQGGEGGQGGAGGGNEVCGDGTLRCAAGRVQQQCADGSWQTVEDCAGKNMLCEVASGTCVPKCQRDADCRDWEKATGERCRGDGRCAPKVFETVWEVGDSNLTIDLPYYDDGTGKAKCDFRILWGDEPHGVPLEDGKVVLDCTRDEFRRHKYDAPGAYAVRILGTYDGWGTNLGRECTYHPLKKLRKVISFGPVGLTRGAFACTLAVDFPSHEVPDASKWTNGSGLFARAWLNSPVVSTWDTSNVTTMESMFSYSGAFNLPLDTWDVSKVTDMASMFAYASLFNQPLEAWDVSGVTTMEQMFLSAVAFNQPLESWDTSNVTTMARMFERATAFNQPLATWNTSNLTTMERMFLGAEAFNQPLESWNTSNVTIMARMFESATAFNQSVEAWDVSGVTTMEEMFYNAVAFNQPLAAWNPVNVRDMGRMFREAEEFDQDLSSWSLSSNVSLRDIFRDSGLSQANYCKLVNLEVWNRNLRDLGKSFSCAK